MIATVRDRRQAQGVPEDRDAIGAGRGQRPVLLLLLLILAVLAYLFADRWLATESHAVLHRPAIAVDLTFIADVPIPFAAVTLVGAWFASLFGWRPGPLGYALLAGAIATLAAVALKDELKYVFGRPWPETWVQNNPSWIRNHVYGFFPFHGGPGYASFPSGHETTISAPCAVLWHVAPRARWLALLLPVLVGAGLLGADYHFLSDILAGFGLGAAVGVSVASLVFTA